MRNLSVTIQTGIQQQITEPHFLVEILWPIPARYSSRSTVTWNNYTWIGIGLEVDISTNGNIQDCQLVIQNTDNAISSLIFNYGANDIPVNIWVDYGEKYLLFAGELNGCNIDLDVVRFNCIATSEQQNYFPRYVVTQSMFHHIPPPGTTLTWTNDKVKIR